VSQALHEKYIPILQFAQGERFYPMAIEDFVGYSALRIKGESGPLVEQASVTPALLARAYANDPSVFLQSLPASLADQNVAADWGRDTLKALVDASYRASRWRAELAAVAYRWFSSKTQGATRLFWWNDLIMNQLQRGATSREELPRLKLPAEFRQVALERYERSQGTRARYVYYYRTARDGDFFCLQYWFFYGYNDWATSFGGMNDHEGDWEGMYLFFPLDAAGRAQEPPAYVTFVGHHSRLTKPWGHPDMTLDGSHPLAYVAAGSHATYPERKAYDLMQIYGLTDHATGDGLTIEPGDWHHGVDLDKQPWTAAFLGAWGTRYWLALSWAETVLGVLKARADDIGLPGVSAPRGPRYADDGSVRPNWIQAAAWAGIFELEAR
jgi:hypothetical protein